MKFRHAFLICMVLLAILTIGFAGAADNSTSADGDLLKETSEVDGDEINLSSQETDVQYDASNPTDNSNGTFSDLNSEINESADELNLTRNYIYSEGDSEHIGGIIIDRQITINGNGFTINGNNMARAFNITASNVILNNITFTNCCAEMGGVICNYGTVTLNNNVFVNNSEAYGGGAIYTKGDMVLNKNYFNNNAAAGGGAILNRGNLNINNASFINNSAIDGAAIENLEGKLDLHDVVFAGNTAEKSALFVNGGDIDLHDVVFANNTAKHSGAIFNSGGVVNLFHVALINNSVSEDASAIGNFYIMNLHDVVFSNNAAGTYGALENSYIMELRDVVFANNVAGYGSAISNVYIMDLQDVVFANNTGVYGGAIYNRHTLSINNSVFVNATSTYSTAIYDEMGSSLFINNTRFVNLTSNKTAGAISVKENGNVYIENCEFINTSSLKNAGAINLESCGNVTVLDTLFRNVSSDFGGAFVQLEGNLVMNNSKFINDFADFNGGALYLSYVNARIDNCTFDSNAAGAFDDCASCGGAIYCDISNLTLTNSNFINNSAGLGSAVYAYDSSYNITKSIFINNTNAVYTEFDREGYFDVNNICIDSNVSTNHTDYPALVYGDGIELKLVNNTIDVADIPLRFDLREWGWVTPVKLQEFKGFCWVFATLASLESSLLKETGVEYVFSENHLGNNAIKYSKYGDLSLSEGGHDFNAVGFVLSWFSLVAEQKDSYDCVGKLSNSGAADNIHIQDVLFIPIKKSDDFIVSNQTNNLIKQTVLRYGAVSMTFAGDGEYLDSRSSIYHNDVYISNHVVSVVGWDDSYSRYNFEITPPGDGAWIIKNSWGDDWGDGGYGYLSYYDTSIFGSTSEFLPYTFAFIIENSENYNYNYQTDLGALGGFDNCTYYSNEFTSVGDDLLGAIGTYFNDTGVEYEFEVYVNDELRLVQTGMSEFAGFRTIVLDKYIPLKTGDRFKVVFKSNAVPYQKYSRQHYLPNASMMSRDGKSWVDLADSNRTVCLKAYTVIDDSKITGNSDISVDYAGGKYFTVRVVTGAGQAVGAGKTVKFTINGKNAYVSTDKNGIAKLKINMAPGTYAIKTTLNGKTQKNIITVKHVLKTSKVTVKKSAKSFVLKANLKINGKAPKGKKVTFTFRGKSYKATTTKYGNAYLVVNKNVMKYLKKGKSYVFKVTYGKDTLKSTVKVR